MNDLNVAIQELIDDYRPASSNDGYVVVADFVRRLLAGEEIGAALAATQARFQWWTLRRWLL